MRMKLNRWIALPVAGLAAAVVGLGAVEAAPSPSPSPSGSTNYAQVFVDKLAGILHLNRAQAQDALKQAQLQTVDQMLMDGRITKAQADAMKARINAGQGLNPIGGLGLRHVGGLGADRGLRAELRTAELNAAAGALHVSAADLQSQLRSGKTLRDLEQAGGVSDAAVKAAMTNAARGVLDKAVKAGTITPDQENRLLSRLGSRLPLGHSQPVPQAPAGFFSPI
jgi:ribosomal protein S20